MAKANHLHEALLNYGCISQTEITKIHGNSLKAETNRSECYLCWCILKIEAIEFNRYAKVGLARNLLYLLPNRDQNMQLDFLFYLVHLLVSCVMGIKSRGA